MYRYAHNGGEDAEGAHADVVRVYARVVRADVVVLRAHVAIHGLAFPAALRGLVAQDRRPRALHFKRSAVEHVEHRRRHRRVSVWRACVRVCVRA